MNESTRNETSFQRLHGLIGRTYNYLFRSFVPQCSYTIRSEASNFWRSSVKDESVMDMSHWRGKGRYADEEKWHLHRNPTQPLT